MQELEIAILWVALDILQRCNWLSDTLIHVFTEENKTMTTLHNLFFGFSKQYGNFLQNIVL